MARDTQPKDLERKFRRAVDKSLEKVADEFNGEFQNAITRPIWNWPRPTKIKNGQEVESPRDIVDLGTLKGSQKREKLNSETIQWTWEVDYSAIVHEGGALKSGESYPKRPWTETAEKAVKPLDSFADILRRELDG